MCATAGHDLNIRSREMKTHPKLALLLFTMFSTCVLIWLALEYAHGVLSPRGLGFALIAACLGIGTGNVLIVRSMAAKYNTRNPTRGEAALETGNESSQQGNRRGFWSFSTSDARWLLFGYVIWFLICRFDISKRHAFEHPMPTLKAAVVAIPLTLASMVLIKINNR
jgi:uncharacterized protein with PQ loop repeat